MYIAFLICIQNLNKKNPDCCRQRSQEQRVAKLEQDGVTNPVATGIPTMYGIYYAMAASSVGEGNTSIINIFIFNQKAPPPLKYPTFTWTHLNKRIYIFFFCRSVECLLPRLSDRQDYIENKKTKLGGWSKNIEVRSF